MPRRSCRWMCRGASPASTTRRELSTAHGVAKVKFVPDQSGTSRKKNAVGHCANYLWGTGSVHREIAGFIPAP
eukprot:431977-Rhodomonas_salina.3